MIPLIDLEIEFQNLSFIHKKKKMAILNNLAYVDNAIKKNVHMLTILCSIWVLNAIKI